MIRAILEVYFGVNLVILGGFIGGEFDPKEIVSYMWGLLMLLFGVVIGAGLLCGIFLEWLFIRIFEK